MPKLTIKELLELKGKRKIIITTAFDYNTARACDMAGVDMVVTWPTCSGTLEELGIVLDQVRKGGPNLLIGAGIPRTPAYINSDEAIRCALFALDHGADMIYSSGMSVDKFKALADQKIPCVGHVGLVPVHSTWFGGLRAVGKHCEEAIEVYKNTLAHQQAGVIAVEMECVPHKVAAEITKRVDILTFSMGSGAECDGQFLFSCDLLGTHDGHYPRHAIRYCNVFDDSVAALKKYKSDIITGNYPQRKHTIEISDEQYGKFLNQI